MKVEWEYKVILPPHGTRATEPWLNDMGSKGWELSCVYEGFFFLKRQKELTYAPAFGFGFSGAKND